MAVRMGLVFYVFGPVAIIIGVVLILTDDPFATGFPIGGTLLIACGVLAVYLSIPLMIFGRWRQRNYWKENRPQ